MDLGYTTVKGTDVNEVTEGGDETVERSCGSCLRFEISEGMKPARNPEGRLLE